MRLLILGVGAVVLLAPTAVAQRRARVGPTLSWISLRDASGTSHTYPSFGGSIALLTGDDAESGITVSRYNDLAQGDSVRRLTFFGLDSYYYPVGPKGIAPYASSAIGLARVTDQDVGFLGICSSAAPTSEIGLGFGLGVRLNIGPQATALVEGRFFQVPNSAIQALEGRANVSLAFGSPRKTELLNGTLGPAVGILTRLGGSMEGRGPTLGVRFRRDTKKAGSLGLQIDYAPLRLSNCPSNCEPAAVLFAPGYEPSLRSSWGRLYFDLGFLLAGFPSPGSDRGLAQGAHAGLGADILSGNSIMWNVNSRVVWLQRNTGENVFLLQAGVSISPRVESR